MSKLYISHLMIICIRIIAKIVLLCEWHTFLMYIIVSRLRQLRKEKEAMNLLKQGFLVKMIDTI